MIPDRYTCEDVLRRIDDYVDRELTLREMELARQHIEICAVCAKEAAFHANVLQSIKQKLWHINLPGDLLSRISAQLDAIKSAEDAKGAPD